MSIKCRLGLFLLSSAFGIRQRESSKSRLTNKKTIFDIVGIACVQRNSDIGRVNKKKVVRGGA